MTAAALLDRRVEDGATIELVQRGEAFDVLVDGRRVMRSDVRRAEKQLVELALAPLGQRDDITVVLAGLGMGFTLRALLDAPGVQRVDVVEASRAVIEWEARHFAGLNGDALKDPRVQLHAVRPGGVLEGAAHQGHRATDRRRLAGAGARPGRRAGADLARRQRRLLRRRRDRAARDGAAAGRRAGAVVGAREPELLQRMHARLKNVAEIVVPVDLDDGKSNLDYVYRGRRPPNPTEPKGPLNLDVQSRSR